MSAADIVSQMFDAFIDGDADTFFSLVTDDFTFSGPTPEPLDAEGWFGIGRLMAEAFPDLDYGFKITGEDGDRVHTVSALSGTHTQDFDLTVMGMGVIPATGKSFQNPPEEGSAFVQGGRVQAVEINPTPGSGLGGILTQIGVDLG
jgi:ketosteroid isomerase-like protein